MKNRLVVMIDAALKKRIQFHGINAGMSITEITEKALNMYMDKVDKSSKG